MKRFRMETHPRYNHLGDREGSMAVLQVDENGPLCFVEDFLKMSVLSEVSMERNRQIQKGFDAKHDDANKVFESFVRDIEAYNIWSRQMYDMASPEKARRRMVQIAALAVAAVEWIDRNAETPLDGSFR